MAGLSLREEKVVIFHRILSYCFLLAGLLALSACASSSLDKVDIKGSGSKYLNSSFSKNPETSSGYFTVRHDYKEKIVGQCKFRMDPGLYIGPMKKHVFRDDASIADQDAGLFRLFAELEFKCSNGEYFNGIATLRYIYTATVDGERRARFNEIKGEAVDGRFVGVVGFESRNKKWDEHGMIRIVDKYFELSSYDPQAGSTIMEVTSQQAAASGKNGGGSSWYDNLRSRKEELRLNSQAPFAKWFSVEADLDEIEGGRKENIVETTMVTGRSASMGALIQYSISPTHLGLPNLTADSYTLDVEFLAQFHMKLENGGLLGSMAGYSNRKNIKKSISLLKSNGYRAKGSVPLGEVDIGGDKQLLIIGARDKLTGFNIVTHIQELR